MTCSSTPRAKVTVAVDVDEMDTAESARVMAQDLTAAKGRGVPVFVTGVAYYQ